MKADDMLLIAFIFLLLFPAAGAAPWADPSPYIQADAEFRCCGGPWRNATAPPARITPGEPFEVRLTFRITNLSSPKTWLDPSLRVPLASARLHSPGFPCNEPQPYTVLRGPRVVLDPNTGRRREAGYCETAGDWTLNPGTRYAESDHRLGDTWDWTSTLTPTGIWNGTSPVNVDLRLYRDGSLEEAAEEVFTIAVVESRGPPREEPAQPAPTASPTSPRPKPATPGFTAAMAATLLLLAAGWRIGGRRRT